MSPRPPQRPGLAPAVPTVPWWRFPIAWLALGLPASAVVAATASAVIAIRHADPVVTDAKPGAHQSADASVEHAAIEPAEAARNHAATPRH